MAGQITRGDLGLGKFPLPFIQEVLKKVVPKSSSSSEAVSLTGNRLKHL